MLTPHDRYRRFRVKLTVILLLLLGGIAALGIAVHWALSLLALLVLFTFWFSRNPARTCDPNATDDPLALIAPADGVIVDVKPLENHEHIAAPGWEVHVFLSVLDVHVNRAPLAGKITHVERQQGIHLDARHPESPTRNAGWRIVVEHTTGIKVAMTMLVGLVARRVRCFARVGDPVERGEHVGFMLFGSRVVMAYPSSEPPAVAKGDVVRAGVTVIGRATAPGASA